MREPTDAGFQSDIVHAIYSKRRSRVEKSTSQDGAQRVVRRGNWRGITATTLFLMLFVGFAAVVTLSSMASAATWYSVTFHAPADSAYGNVVPVAAYHGMQIDEFGFRVERVLYARGDVSSGRPVPSVPGVLDSVWFSASDDARPRMFWLYSADSSGNWSPPSNPIVYAMNVLRDTFFVDLTGSSDRFTEKPFIQSRPALASPGKWFATWTRVPGDSAFTILPKWRTELNVTTPMLSGREFQWRDRIKACEIGALFGWPFWAEADQWRPCE